MGVLLAGLSAAIFWIDLRTPLGVADGVLYVAVVLLSLPAGKARAVCGWSAAASLLVLAGWAWSPPGGSAAVVAANRLLSLAAIWAVAVTGLARQATGERLAKAEAELARREALAALGRVAAIVAHRIRNPLGSVLTAARHLAAGDLAPAEAAELRAALERESGALQGFLDEYLRVASSRGLALGEEDLSRDLGEVLGSAAAAPRSAEDAG